MVNWHRLHRIYTQVLLYMPPSLLFTLVYPPLLSLLSLLSRSHHLIDMLLTHTHATLPMIVASDLLLTIARHHHVGAIDFVIDPRLPRQARRRLQQRRHVEQYRVTVLLLALPTHLIVAHLRGHQNMIMSR